jgi:hypothetical protein
LKRGVIPRTTCPSSFVVNKAVAITLKSKISPKTRRRRDATRNIVPRSWRELVHIVHTRVELPRP